MASDEIIFGNCPHCKNNTKFREFSLTESVSSLGGFIGGFLSSGITGKANHASTLVNAFADKRNFPNYKCGTCGGGVMQCSECKEIVPYAHDSIAHVCGSAKLENSAETKVSLVKESSNAIDIDDLISKIERLASLKDKGALTIEEFEIQKKRLLG